MKTAQLVQLLRGMMYSTAIAFLIVAMLFLIDAGTLITKLSTNSDQGSELLKEAQKRLKDTSQNLNALLLQSSLTAENIRRVSENQDVYNTRLLALVDHSDDTVQELDRAIGNIDFSIAMVSKDSSDGIKELTKLEGETAQALKVNSVELTKVLQSAQEDIQDLSAVVNSDNTKYLMAQVASTASSLAGASANIEVATSDIAQAVHSATRPKSLAVRMLSVGGSVGRWFLR